MPPLFTVNQTKKQGKKKRGEKGRKQSNTEVNSLENKRSWPDLPDHLLKLISKQPYLFESISFENTRSWPDLPDHLFKLISNQPHRLECISFGGVSKMWQSPSRKCNSIKQYPHLVSIDEDENNRIHLALTLPWCKVYWRKLHRYNWKYCVGSSHGWLVMRGSKSSQYYLINPIGNISNMELPPCDSNVTFQHVVLSSKPRYCTVLVITGGSPLGFMFFKLGFKQKYLWTKEECNLHDPNSMHKPCTIQIASIVAFKGKFYGLSLQGTLVVIDIDSYPRTAILSVRRAIPSTMSRYFREYLVESWGEILVIYLISRRTTNVVDDVEVFQLDLSYSSWIKLKSLGDRMLFVGLNSCMTLSGSDLGCQGNQIYFRHRMTASWWVFDMESGSINPSSSVNSTDINLPSLIRRAQTYSLMAV